MTLKQYDIWLADLNPTSGTEAGKLRPVAIIQTNLLNEFHRSTLVCPVTTKIKPDADLLRVHLSKRELAEKSDILVDQIRAIDNKKLIKKLGKLNQQQVQKLRANLKIVLDLE